MKDALAFDSKDLSDIEDAVQDIKVLKESFQKHIMAMKSDYLDRVGDIKSDVFVSEIVDMFSDSNVRQKFYQRWRELEDIYNIISPDEFLRPYLDDFDKFARIYRIVRMYYDNSVKPDIDLSEKTAKLVRENTSIGEFNPPKTMYSINERTLSQIKSDQKTDRERILSMINSIQNEVESNKKEQPFLISIGEKANEIATMYTEGQKLSEEIAKELESIIDEIIEANKEQKSRKMSPDIFSLFWFIKKKGVASPEKIASYMAAVLTKYPKWRTNSRQERDIRLELNKALEMNVEDDDIDQIKKNAEIAKEIIDRMKANGNGK